VCVRGGDGGPLYSANRSVLALNEYGNIVHRLGVDQDDLPAKDWAGWRQQGVGRPRGSTDPRVQPLALPFILDTARWGPILCMSVPGLCTSVFSVKWALLLSVTQDAIFCGFLLHILCVFILFPTCVPAINNSPTLMKFISNNSYYYC